MEDINKKVDELSDQLIKSTQEIVRIKSVQDTAKEKMPFGEDVNKCLDYALDLSESLGFKAVNLDGYIGYAEYGEGEPVGVQISAAAAFGLCD
jgi:succinyl-diaminopimelate desuccinylase